MKKRIASVILAVCICLCTFVLPSSDSIAQNNDSKYDSYVNMTPNTDGHARYIVPNLYRQDASYINVKTFPLVVNGGVEYFPLDIFALYPYLQVVYSKIAHGFYINNTKNNHYVAFDMETGTTTTHDAQLLGIQAKIFNRTYYVPAAKVCEILEMRFETYDDPTAGIRAARISDSKAKMTLPQLVTAYSPVKKDPAADSVPDSPNSTGEQNPDNGNNTDVSKPPIPEQPTTNDNPVIPIPPTTVNPDDGQSESSDTNKPDNKPDAEPVDPITLVKNRYIHLTFDAKGADVADGTLELLAEKDIKAAFFVDKSFILTKPDTVRRMLIDGHFVGISFDAAAQNGETPTDEELLLQINQTNDALYLVTKTKTRYIRAGYGYGDKLKDSGFADFAVENGYEMCVSSFDSGAADNYRNTQLNTLITNIIGEHPGAERRVVIRFALKNGTPALLDALTVFSGKYPQFMLVATDEYTLNA